MENQNKNVLKFNIAKSFASILFFCREKKCFRAHIKTKDTIPKKLQMDCVVSNPFKKFHLFNKNVLPRKKVESQNYSNFI